MSMFSKQLEAKLAADGIDVTKDHPTVPEHPAFPTIPTPDHDHPVPTIPTPPVVPSAPFAVPNMVHVDGDNQVGQGTDGVDYMFAGGNHDKLLGGKGDDLLFATRGDTVLVGGEGNDKLFGSIGHDTFAMDKTSGHDTVYNFVVGQDVLKVAGATAADVHFELDAAHHGLMVSYGESSMLLLGHDMHDVSAIQSHLDFTAV